MMGAINVIKFINYVETKLAVWLCHRYYKRNGYSIAYIRDSEKPQFYLTYTEDPDVYIIVDKFIKHFDKYGIYMYDQEYLYVQYMSAKRTSCKGGSV